MARQTLPVDGEVPYGDKLRTAINNISDAIDANSSSIATLVNGSVFAPSAGPVPAAYAGINDPRFTSVDTVKKTADATLLLSEAGKAIEYESATPGTLTIPSGYPDGTLLDLSQMGDGQMTVAPGSGVTLLSANGLRTRAKYSGMSGRKRPSSGSTGALPTTNLLMRYRADDIVASSGTVASWPESSGNGLPAAVQATAGAQPTITPNSLNGHKTLSFDGGDFMTLSGSALAVAQNKSVLTVFVIYSYPTAATGIRTLFSLSSGTGAAATRAQVYQKDPSGFLAAGGRRLDTDTVSFPTSSVASTAGASEVIAGSFNYAAANVSVHRNGTQLSSSAFQTAGSTSNTPSLAGVIGANLAATAEFFIGKMAEILVYSEVSSSLRAAVDTYAQTTYGITVTDALSIGDVWHITGDTVV